MIYLAFNKPYLVMSQFKPVEGKLTLLDYIKRKEKPKAAGRLDFDSEGLLFLSDNLRFIETLTHPSKNIEKEYLAQVEGEITDEAIEKLKGGIITQTESYKECKAEKSFQPEWLWERNPPIRERKNIPTSWVRVIITEGKNRQVRHMCAHVGFPALRLIRTRIGPVELGEIKPGEFRSLSTTELQKFIGEKP